MEKQYNPLFFFFGIIKAERRNTMSKLSEFHSKNSFGYISFLISILINNIDKLEDDYV